MGKKLLTLVLMFSLILSGCTKKTNPDVTSEETETSLRTEIVWTIGGSAQMPQENIDKLNQALADKGYDFYVTFQYIGDYEGFPDAAAGAKYQKELIKSIKNQETDLFFCGWEYESVPWLVTEFLDSGLLYPLNDWLESEQGKSVYQLYDQEIWKSGSVNGKIYGFPNETNVYSEAVKIAFNKEYIPEEEIEGWDGTLKGLMSILDHTEIGEGEIMIAGFPSWNGFTRFVPSMKYLMMDNFYADLDGQRLYQPFEIKEFHDYLSFWNQSYQKGYLYSVSMDGGTYTGEEYEVIQQKKYAVDFEPADCGDPSFVYKTAPFCVGCDTGTMTGISNTSEKKEQCLQLMQALRTDDTLANLLIWGDTAEHIAGDDGYALDAFTPSGRFDIGLADGVIQEPGVYSADLRAYKREQLSSSLRRENTLIGFQPDYSGMHKEMKKYLNTLDQYKNCWKEKDFEKVYREGKDKLEKASDKLLKTLNRQLKKYKSEDK